jgi:putative tricarboxylic transport membrane protein
MRLALPRSQDFWAGLLFMAFGGLALVIGSEYSLGTPRRMGPGYFPAILGLILCVLGLIIAARGLRREGETVPRGALRPFLVLIAVLAFGLLLQPLGLVLATLALVVVSSAGGAGFRLKEVLITAAFLIVMAVVVFAWGLGLQFSIWPSWG